MFFEKEDRKKKLVFGLWFVVFGHRLIKRNILLKSVEQSQFGHLKNNTKTTKMTATIIMGNQTKID